jgi:hypothetical protein
MMDELHRVWRLCERPEYRDAFEHVVTLWEELEKNGLLATVRMERMMVLHDRQVPISALAVLLAFQDCNEPLPDRLRNKVTRYLDFRDCVTYADMANFLNGVCDPPRAQDRPARAKLNWGSQRLEWNPASRSRRETAAQVKSVIESDRSGRAHKSPAIRSESRHSRLSIFRDPPLPLSA